MLLPSRAEYSLRTSMQFAEHEVRNTTQSDRTWIPCLVSMMIGCACAGCVGDRRDRVEVKWDLIQIAFAYHNFHAEHGRGPRSAEELLGFEDPAARLLEGNADVQSGSRRAVQSGEYVIIWNVAIQRRPEQNAGKVLAYQRETPETGGFVAYQDASVAFLTPEEFARTPKSNAAPSESSSAEAGSIDD